MSVSKRGMLATKEGMPGNLSGDRTDWEDGKRHTATTASNDRFSLLMLARTCSKLCGSRRTSVCVNLRPRRQDPRKKKQETCAGRGKKAYHSYLAYQRLSLLLEVRLFPRAHCGHGTLIRGHCSFGLWGARGGRKLWNKKLGDASVATLGGDNYLRIWRGCARWRGAGKNT